METDKRAKPVPATTEYKILQELKRLVDVITETNVKLEYICADIRRNRGG